MKYQVRRTLAGLNRQYIKYYRYSGAIHSNSTVNVN